MLFEDDLQAQQRHENSWRTAAAMSTMIRGFWYHGSLENSIPQTGFPTVALHPSASSSFSSASVKSGDSNAVWSNTASLGDSSSTVMVTSKSSPSIKRRRPVSAVNLPDSETFSSSTLLY